VSLGPLARSVVAGWISCHVRIVLSRQPPIALMFLWPFFVHPRIKCATWCPFFCFIVGVLILCDYFAGRLTTTFCPLIFFTVFACADRRSFFVTRRLIQRRKSVVEPSGHLTFPFLSSRVCVVSHLSPRVWLTSVFPVFVHTVTVTFPLWEYHRLGYLT